MKEKEVNLESWPAKIPTSFGPVWPIATDQGYFELSMGLGLFTLGRLVSGKEVNIEPGQPAFLLWTLSFHTMYFLSFSICFYQVISAMSLVLEVLLSTRVSCVMSMYLGHIGLSPEVPVSLPPVSPSMVS